MMHDKEIMFLGSKTDKNDNDEEIPTDDIELVNMGKQSAPINKDNVHRRYDEIYQICDDIDRHEDDKV